MSLFCVKEFILFATPSILFLKSLEAIDTLMKLQIVQASISNSVGEVQTNAYNLLSETENYGVVPKLETEPMIVQFPFKKNM